MSFIGKILTACEEHLLAFEQDSRQLVIKFGEDELVKLGQAIEAALAARSAPPAPAAAPAPAEEPPTPSP